MDWREQNELIKDLEELLKLKDNQLRWLWSLLAPEVQAMVRKQCKELPF